MSRLTCLAGIASLIVSIFSIGSAATAQTPARTSGGAPTQGGAASDDVAAVLARYVSALGGAANLDRIQSRVTKARLSAGLFSGTVETVQRRPDRFSEQGRVTLGGAFSSGYDGTTGWSESQDDGFQVMSGIELQQQILAYRLDCHQWARCYPRQTRLADRVVRGRRQQALLMTTSFGTTETWYIDATTGLLAETVVREERTGSPPVTVITALSDYRTVDGVLIPFRFDITEGKDRFTIRVTSIEHNTPIDPRRFAPPAK